MACKAECGKDAEKWLRGIFSTLSSYRWTTQVLLVLAVFAQQYGEFWYISKAPSEGGNAPLKGLSSLKKNLISEKKAVKVVPLNKVVVDLLDWTNSLVNLETLVTQHRGKHVLKLAKAFQTMPEWSCQAIIAILASGDYFAWLMDDDKLAEPLELHTLASSVLALLWDCKRETDWIDQIDRIEKYHKYVEKVVATVDIVDFLNSLLTAKDSSQDPIVTGPSDTPVRFELFSKKRVLLIISDLKISMDDIETLRIIYEDPQRLQKSPKGDDQEDGNIPIQTEKETLYELVWIPIADERLKYREEALSNLKSLMPWAYRVDPQRMNRWAPTYIKEQWRFKRETMVVVLDSLGRVENRDAMPMLRLREIDAFPYTWNESTHLWRGRRNWFHLLLSKPEKDGTLDAVKDEYILFSGGLPAVEVAGDAYDGVHNFREVPIGNMKYFRILLRSCLITRLQDLQIRKEGGNALLDRMVYEMSEVYQACRRGGVAILTKRQDLELRLVGLSSDLKLVRDQAEDGWTDLAKFFEKKYEDSQQQSKCLHVCVPQYPDLEDLYCPLCNQLMDLCLECCHTDSD